VTRSTDWPKCRWGESKAAQHWLSSTGEHYTNRAASISIRFQPAYALSMLKERAECEEAAQLVVGVGPLSMRCDAMIRDWQMAWLLTMRNADLQSRNRQRRGRWFAFICAEE